MKTFNVISGALVASDPCYSINPPTWCQGIIENVKKGEWVAIVEPFENRIASLTIFNKEENQHNSIPERLFLYGEEFSFDGGVDSGQFGFFDMETYRQDLLANGLPKADFGDGYDKEEGDVWYRAVCDLTLGSESWGVLPNGVASSSGFGDGSYPVYGVKNDMGEWVGLKVVFIDIYAHNDVDEDEDVDVDF